MPLYLEKLYHTASLYPVALTQAWQSRSLRVRADCLFNTGDRFNARLDYRIPLTDTQVNGDSLQEDGVIPIS